MVAAAGVTGLAGLLAGTLVGRPRGAPTDRGPRMVGIIVSATLTYAGASAAAIVRATCSASGRVGLRPGHRATAQRAVPDVGVRASAAGWFLVAGVIGAVAGLIAFGAVAEVDNRFSLAAS